MRKLACICSGFAAAVFLSEYLLPPGALLWAAFGIGSAALILAASFKSRSILLSLILLGFVLGCFRCWVHFRCVIAPSEDLDGEKRVISARVLEYPDIYENAEYVIVRLTGDHPTIKSRLVSYDGGLADLKPGDSLTAEVKLRSAMHRYGKETDRYSSKGIFLLATVDSAVNVERGRSGLFAFPQQSARWILTRCGETFPEDAAPFMMALLTGDKTEFYEDEVLNSRMSRVGLSHVVAVSGMHISFLMGALLLLIPNRRRCALIGLPVLLLFSAMTGFTPSVCRAAFMQAYILSAGLFGREGDNCTSLSTILAALLLINPSSAASVSLQLSFAATAGILLFSGRIHSALCRSIHGTIRNEHILRALMAAAGSLSVSLGALVFSTPLVAVHFGYVSVVSPLSNFLCLWLIPLLFLGGYAAVLVGAVIPVLGSVLGWILSIGVRCISIIISLLCRVPLAAVYTQNRLMVLWLILTYAIFIAFLFFGRRNKTRKIWIPLLISSVFLVLFALHASTTRENRLSVTALDVGQGQCIVLEYGDRAVVVDCGSSASLTDPGQIAAQYLYGRGHTDVDFLILTHLDRDHVSGVPRFLASIPVTTAVLPGGLKDNGGELDNILTVAQSTGTRVYWLRENKTLTLDGMTLELFPPLGRVKNKNKCLSVLASDDAFDVLILGDMDAAGEKLLIKLKDLPDTEVLVAAHHGSASSTCPELLEAITPETAIISVGYNSYGHPREDVLQRLDSSGIEIMRTDLQGNILICAPKE